MIKIVTDRFCNASRFALRRCPADTLRGVQKNDLDNFPPLKFKMPNFGHIRFRFNESEVNENLK